MKHKILLLLIIGIISRPFYATQENDFNSFRNFLKNNTAPLGVGVFTGAWTLGQLQKSNFRPWQIGGYSLLSTLATYFTYDTMAKKLPLISIKNKDDKDDEQEE